MSIRYLLMLLLGVLDMNGKLILKKNVFDTYFFAVEILPMSDFESYFTLSGQIIYPIGSHVFIPPESRLIVELDDISVTDTLFKNIAQTIVDVDVFPISFNLSYAISDVIPHHVHVLNARIINKDANILFTNSKRIEVKLLGGGRTTFIDIPIAPIACKSIISVVSSLTIRNLL